MRKFAAAVTIALLALSSLLLTGAPSQAADDYTAGVRTSCHLAVPAVISVGDAPRIRVTVRPNAPSPAAGTRSAARADQPTGTVTVSISKGGTSIFSKTVAYDGAPVTVQGPRITEPGHYVVRGRFKTDDGSSFKSCNDNTAFDVRRGNSPDDNPPTDGGNDSPDGLLPDTGGPDLRWLLLGLALVASGAGLVVAARDRRRDPYPV